MFWLCCVTVLGLVGGAPGGEAPCVVDSWRARAVAAAVAAKSGFERFGSSLLSSVRLQHCVHSSKSRTQASAGAE